MSKKAQGKNSIFHMKCNTVIMNNNLWLLWKLQICAIAITCFCYLEESLNTTSEREAAVMAKTGLMMSRACQELLLGKKLLLMMKGRTCQSGVKIKQRV